MTQRGDCDPTYNFMVDVVNGNITHPNILTFRGRDRSVGRCVARFRSAEDTPSGLEGVRSVRGEASERPFGRYTMCRYWRRREITTPPCGNVEFEHAYGGSDGYAGRR